ncbi:MAG: YicC/YloC family endoribonuclease [Pseudomonadota bacterium]
MTRSMTGFASREGHHDVWSWSWDLRSVNGRGLDIRLRLPDWIEGLEAPVRASLQGVAARGNVTLGLRVAREQGVAAPELDADTLSRALLQIRRVEAAATKAGVQLRNTSAAEVLALRGVQDSAALDQDTTPLKVALLADLKPLLAAFVEMRETEGTALHRVIADQLDRISQSASAARDVLDARADHMKAANAEALARVMEATDGADPDRLAQELALIAVKSDVAEELDRLDAHVVAARDLLASEGAKGRKLDFLTQEFNREANTLCSKAQFSELTRIGLDLKHTIDQMREQVQNVE